MSRSTCARSSEQTVVQPFVDGYAAGPDAEPVHALQRGVPLRRARRVRGAVPAPTSSGPATTRARRARRHALVARGVDPAKDQSYMLATVDPALLDRVAFPLGGNEGRRAREAEGAGLAARSRAESQEACFLAGDDYRAFLERRASSRARARSSTRTATCSGATTASGGSRPASGGHRVARREPLYALRTDRDQHARGRAARRARAPDVSVVVASTLRRRADAKLRYRSEPVAARSSPPTDGFALELDAGRRGRAGPGRRALRR